MLKIVKVNPFRCRLWESHSRMDEYLTEESCKQEIQSIGGSGQLVPAIGRQLKGDSTFDMEIICGARRLFVARHLNVEITVDVRELSDLEAAVILDIENRQRRDFSPYERGRSFAKWLSMAYFDSQDELSRALKISPSQVSRLLKLAKLPSVVVAAFSDPCDICEMWGLDLFAACNDSQKRLLVVGRARALRDRVDKPSARDVYEQLVAESGSKRVRLSRKHEIVKNPGGETLFKIKHHDTSVELCIEKRKLSADLLTRIKHTLSELLQDASSQALVPKRHLPISSIDGRNNFASPSPV